MGTVKVTFISLFSADELEKWAKEERERKWTLDDISVAYSTKGSFLMSVKNVQQDIEHHFKLEQKKSWVAETIDVRIYWTSDLLCNQGGQKLVGKWLSSRYRCSSLHILFDQNLRPTKRRQLAGGLIVNLTYNKALQDILVGLNILCK